MVIQAKCYKHLVPIAMRKQNEIKEIKKNEEPKQKV